MLNSLSFGPLWCVDLQKTGSSTTAKKTVGSLARRSHQPTPQNEKPNHRNFGWFEFYSRTPLSFCGDHFKKWSLQQ